MSPPRSDWTTSTPAAASDSGEASRLRAISDPSTLPPAEGDDRQVLDEQKFLFTASQHTGMCLLLQFPRGAVGELAEIGHEH